MVSLRPAGRGEDGVLVSSLGAASADVEGEVEAGADTPTGTR